MGSLTFDAGSLVYLDTVAVIYSLERYPDYWPTLRTLWQQSARREIALVSSELTLLETLVGPIKAGDREMAKDYERLLTATEFRLLAITARELKLAAWLRANAGIKTPDAIHAATALLVACDAFVSNDADFRRIDDLPLRLLREP